MTLISSGFPTTQATIRIGLPAAGVNVSRVQTTAQALLTTGGFIDPALSVDAIVQLDSKDEFPEIGRVSALYLDKQDGIVYRWDKDTEEYVSISASQISSDITPGALVFTDENGILKCSGINYEELNTKLTGVVQDISGLPHTRSGDTIQITSLPVELLVDSEDNILILDCGSSNSVI